MSIHEQCLNMQCTYRSESVPTHKRAPTPYFSPYRAKVYLNERPLWSELHVEFEKHSLKRNFM